ncbi:hypothetical protein H2199_003433 [Coniosporium tulheliwenetii]|uniref:Uncharacterized protein n=1 Tax=Coniosporium tulheliwenetii TaxID=3383036 RepID=A0ACC2ZB05_9PEZI|nr:hypothetical protein H2199_003433 [Cladosporium sp. JES 115]
MRTPILWVALGAVTGTIAQIPWDVVDAAPAPPSPTIAIGVAAQTVEYKPEEASASVEAEILAHPIATEAESTVPLPTETGSTIEKRELSKRACEAQAIGAPVPSGYTNTFTNLKASNNAYGYMGFTTLKTYDSNACASKCNAIMGCAAFNLYFERNPINAPGDDCKNPPSSTHIKCVFWGGPVFTENAKNSGQWRRDFQVVIAGSNGYVSNSIKPIQGYTGPTYLGKASIQAPLDCSGSNTIVGSTMFTEGPFDAGLCASACAAHNEYARNAAVKPRTCHFFNTYLLLKNGISTGQVCVLYSKSWDASYAKNTGEMRGSDKYTIAFSYSFVDSQDPGKPAIPCDVAAATSLIKTSSLEPFCTNLLGYAAPTETISYTVTTTLPVTAFETSGVVTAMFTTTAFTTVTKQHWRKRGVLTPEALATIPPSVVSAACGLRATKVTTTDTVSETASATDLVTEFITVPSATVTETTAVMQTATSYYCGGAAPTNIGFEAGLSGWAPEYYLNGGPATVEAQEGDRLHAWCRSNVGWDYAKAGIHKVLETCPGTTYKLVFTYKQDTGYPDWDTNNYFIVFADGREHFNIRAGNPNWLGVRPGNWDTREIRFTATQKTTTFSWWLVCGGYSQMGYSFDILTLESV